MKKESPLFKHGFYQNLEYIFQFIFFFSVDQLTPKADPQIPSSVASSQPQFKILRRGLEKHRAKAEFGLCLLLCATVQIMIPLGRVWGIMSLCFGAACTPAGSVLALFCGFLGCQTRAESNSCYSL